MPDIFEFVHANATMHPIKHLLAHSYYFGTLGFRRLINRQDARAGRAPIILPVFHRIADDRANAWTTSSLVFRQAIRWLKQHFDLISLEEAQRRMRAQATTRPAVSVTFDDGYAINYDTAVQVLLDEGVPCTYFVTAGPVLEHSFFEHDLRMGNRFAANTVHQLREMSAAGIEIGAHTRTHADLGQVMDQNKLVDELVIARSELEDALGQPVRYFAFPYGAQQNLTAAAFQLAKQVGYAGVCSNYGGYNFPGDDPFHLHRRGVDGAELIRLKNWVSRDPFRNRTVARFIAPATN